LIEVFIALDDIKYIQVIMI